MTKEEAIENLKELIDTYITCHGEEDTVAVSLDNVDVEALDMAIKALEQEPRWFSVSERLPEEDTDVLVTLKCGLIGIMQKKLADDDNCEPCYIWQDFEGEEHEVIAWMPLPLTYKAESEE